MTAFATGDHSTEKPSQPQQQRNVEAIAKVEAAVLGERSSSERLARALIRRLGTPWSLVLHTGAVVVWIAANTISIHRFDPYPFNLLALVSSVEAILLGLLILISQNRLQHEAERRAHLNLQINMLAELEGAKVLQMLDRLCRHSGVEGITAELLGELTSDTDPTTIAESLKASMPGEE